MSTTFISVPDTRTTTLVLALELVDGVTGADRLAGEIEVQSSRGGTPRQKQGSSTYLFFDLPPGPSTLSVRSTEQPPLYQPTDVAVTVPPANPKLPVASATLIPTAAYPFAVSATLVRGYVLSNNLPVNKATVSAPGAAFTYTTSSDGEYVLLFPRITSLSQTITITAAPPVGAAKSVAVMVQRGMTVSQPITL